MRLYEKKDNLIKKNPNLTEEQKQETDSQLENLAKMASETLGIHVEIE